jgi:RND superfamily putative drug exporter
MLYRLGLAVARHAKLVLIIGAVFLIGAAALGSRAFGELSSGGFDDPSSPSSRANALADQHFGAAPNLVLVASARDGDIDAPGSLQAGRELTDRLAAEPGVTVTASFFRTPVPSLVATDRHSAMILAVIAGDQGHMVDRGAEIIARYAGDDGPLTIRFGGAAGVFGDINTQVSTSLLRAESVAVPLTMILVLLVFGSVVAALLPLLIGGVAIVGTFAELAVLGNLTDVSVFAINLTTALGLGLGIDYGLLIVARFREQLAAGDDVHAAVARTVATAGRTIAFSAAAVTCALATLLVFPLFFLSSFGYAGIGVVVIAAIGALTITPAALALLGTRVDAGRLPWAGTARGSSSPFFRRLATTVFRKPVRTALPVLAVLLLAAAPLLGISFSLPDQTVLPESAQSRQVSDLIEAEFPTRATATIPVVLEQPAEPAVAARYAVAMSSLPGVRAVAGPGMTAVRGVAGPADPAAGAMSADGWQRLSVLTAAAPGSDAARRVVDELRALPVAGGPGFLVGGGDAALADTLAAIGRPLPLAFGIIVLTTFVLLFLFTGSVVQPVRALVVNGLSLSAAVGIVTWVFQDGHLISLFGATARPMDASMTVLLLCITFGLSMDDEVFLSSRFTEMSHGGAGLAASVTDGLARTGRIVTSAAVLLAVSFFAFASSTVSMLQLFGLGAGLAVLIDATLIRGVLVPAAMRMLGRANFWAPRPLRAVYATVGLSED